MDKKTTWLLILAVWVMIGCALLSKTCAAETRTMYVQVHEGTYLNGRSRPDLKGEVMMRMDRGFEVTVLSVKNGWALIEGGESGTCWCSVEHLADFSPDEQAPQYTVAANGRVRVRQSPNGRNVRYVRSGDTVTVYFILDGWAFIGDGYIMAEFIKERD